MHFIVSGSSQPTLAAKLVEVGIWVMTETGTDAAPGILYSYIGTRDDGLTHAFVDIDETKVTNATEIFDALPKSMVNVPGAPLRAKVGEVPPEVVDALPDWAYRKALDRLALTAAWDTAVAAAGKDAQIWWDRAIKITTLEDEWKAIVAVMEWGDETERRLINRAHNIADPTPKAEEPVEPVVTP